MKLYVTVISSCITYPIVFNNLIGYFIKFLIIKEGKLF